MPQVLRGFFDEAELYELINIENKKPRKRQTHNMRLFCQHCKQKEHVTITREPETSPHYAKAICDRCGQFIKWLPKPRKR